jgi:hypothetical protein
MTFILSKIAILSFIDIITYLLVFFFTLEYNVILSLSIFQVILFSVSKVVQCDNLEVTGQNSAR